MSRLSRLSPLFLFITASFFMGLYGGLYEPSFNNYLAQVHHISEIARGGLEFPRELPGFLMAFILALLIFLPDTRIALLAAAMVGFSLWGQGFLAPNMRMVVFWMLLWSTGQHLFMVLKSSVALRLAEPGHEGRTLGTIGAMEAGGALLGMLLVYFGVSYFHFSFPVIFGLGGSFALLAALILFPIKPEPMKRPPHYLLFKKRYTLFYLLNVLFGARKQIFLTFGPWVLIQIFHCEVSTFAILGLVGTGFGLFFRPWLGRAIDDWGEKIILALEAIVLIAICLLYAFSIRWFSAPLAVLVIMACYVTDQLLFAVSMARTTYLNRIAESSDDIAPTLSMGVTIDHAVSMVVPLGGGLLWAHYGFEWVFLAATVIALGNLVAAFFLPAHALQPDTAPDASA